MRQFQEGDKVKIIEMPKDGRQHINKLGTVMPPGGTYEEDDVYVKLQNEDIVLVKESQLILFQ